MKLNYYVLFGIIAIVYFLGINIDVMDIDAAQYASMSREMLDNKSFFELYDIKSDYLDKPPLLIWLCSLSMSLFGVNNFAFKLPNIIFALLAIYFTYRFSKIYYKKEIAFLSALILALSQAMFLMTNDCRTDCILMSLVIFSCWQIAEWLENKNRKNILLAFIGIGLGVLTKGPVALLVPIFAFAPFLLLKLDFKNIFRWEYLLGLIIIGIIITPFCIGLYNQFDLHPEKNVYGKSGTSGVRFFLWTQSFGRITGESHWKNGAYFTFLFENMFWSFLPWIFFFIPALIKEFLLLIKNKFKVEAGNIILLSGFVLTYISLGLSNYQLPHYIFVAFPFASIITANFIFKLFTTNYKFWSAKFVLVFQFIITALLGAGCFLIALNVFPTENVLIFTIPLFILVAIAVLIFLKTEMLNRLILISFGGMVLTNIFLSTHFYPNLLNYQMGSSAGKIVSDNKVKQDEFCTYRLMNSHSLHFYSKQYVKHFDSFTPVPNYKWILTDEQGYNEMNDYGIKTELVKRSEYFSIANLTFEFLYFQTRETTTKEYFLVKNIGLK